MSRLRDITAIAVAATMMAASFPASPVLAQAPVVRISTTPTAPVDQTRLIRSTVNAFPSAGEPLKLAISDLIVKDPDRAATVASYLRTETSLTPAQKQAILAGLTDALDRLGIVDQVDTGPDYVTPVLLILLAGGVGVGIWALLANNHNNSTPAPVPSPN